jgi:hypothetical protein
VIMGCSEYESLLDEESVTWIEWRKQLSSTNPPSAEELIRLRKEATVAFNERKSHFESCPSCAATTFRTYAKAA